VKMANRSISPRVRLSRCVAISFRCAASAVQVRGICCRIQSRYGGSIFVFWTVGAFDFARRFEKSN
jgi:hypothetical protein